MLSYTRQVIDAAAIEPSQSTDVDFHLRVVYCHHRAGDRTLEIIGLIIKIAERKEREYRERSISKWRRRRRRRRRLNYLLHLLEERWGEKSWPIIKETNRARYKKWLGTRMECQHPVSGSTIPFSFFLSFQLSHRSGEIFGGVCPLFGRERERELTLRECASSVLAGDLCHIGRNNPSQWYRSSSTIADWNSFAHSPVDLWFDWVAHQMFPTQRTDEERISYLRTVYPLPALSWNWLAFYETRPYSSSSPSPSSSCNILSCALYSVSFCGSPCRLHPPIVQLSEHQDTV